MSLGKLILNYISFVQTLVFSDIYKVLILCLSLIWLAVIIWLYKDASKRYKHYFWIVLVCLLILPFNFVGLIIYLLIRPSIITDESVWLDLERKYLQYEVDGIGYCSCGELSKPDYLVCPKCSKQIRDLCKSCSRIIELDWVLCPFCKVETGYKPDIKINKRSANVLVRIFSDFIDMLKKSLNLGKEVMSGISKSTKRNWSILRRNFNILSSKLVRNLTDFIENDVKDAPVARVYKSTKGTEVIKKSDVKAVKKSVKSRQIKKNKRNAKRNSSK